MRRGSSSTDCVSQKIEEVSDPGVRDARMASDEMTCVSFELLLCIGNPYFSLAIILYWCIHKPCIRMVMWTCPILGDSLARCRIRGGVRHQWWRMVRLRLGLCSSLLMGKESRRWRPRRLVPLLFSVCTKIQPQLACNGRKLLNSPNLCNNLDMWLYYLSGMALIVPEMMILYVIASDPGTITPIQESDTLYENPIRFTGSHYQILEWHCATCFAHGTNKKQTRQLWSEQPSRDSIVSCAKSGRKGAQTSLTALFFCWSASSAWMDCS